jgi:hypothetical protein
MLIKHGKHRGKDISDEKIYWDTEKKQFRRRIYCECCDTPVTCMCYETLRQALKASEYAMICNYCFVAEKLANEDIKSAMIGIPEELNIQELVDIFNDPAVPDNIRAIIKISDILRSKIAADVMQETCDRLDNKWDYIINGAECNL